MSVDSTAHAGDQMAATARYHDRVPHLADPMKQAVPFALALSSVAVAAPHEGHDHQASAQHRARELVAAFESRGSNAEPIVFAFDHERRRTVDFFPLMVAPDGRGVKLGRMSLGQRRATHAMLREVLSEQGYLCVQAIRSLEDVLRANESGSMMRLSDAYVAQVFGTPGPDEPWGFKFEGHHLSVNTTFAGDSFRGTPLFLGANPAEVRGGADTGLRVLGPQEDLARGLFALLDDEQRALAVIGEFDSGPRISVGPLPERAAAAGLPAERMSDTQRALLVQTIASYAHHLPSGFAIEELARIEAAGIEALHFSWRGSAVAGEPFSYRIDGPTVAIQFDAIEDRAGSGANHVHCLWSDPERDFGEDLLERHYAEAHSEPVVAAGASSEEAQGSEAAADALRQQVWDREVAFAATMAGRDHEAFASFLSEEAVFFSGATPMRGRAAVAAGWKPFFEGAAAPFSWEPDAVEVLPSGDLALSSGPVRAPTGQQVGRFNSIWRLEDGVWRVVFDKGDE